MTLDELKKWVDSALRYNDKKTKVVCRSESGKYFDTHGFISKTGHVDVENTVDFYEEEQFAAIIDIFEKD